MNNPLRGFLCLSLVVLAGCGQREADTPKAAPTKSENASPSATPTARTDGTREPEKDNLLHAWATRAHNAKINGKVIGTVAIHGKTFPVVSTGTLTSWANEDKDKFAIRAARYMRGMSSVTGHAHCGQICSADGRPTGPFSIDILTNHNANACAPLAMCSMPNGSGLEHLGKSTGDAMLTSEKPYMVAALDIQGIPDYGNTQFTLLDDKGNPKEGAEATAPTQHYLFKTHNVLIHHKNGEKPREVYDFGEENKPKSISKKQ